MTECYCGHDAAAHVDRQDACLAHGKEPEEDMWVCACRRFRVRDIIVHREASDVADMAFLSRISPPLGRPLSPSRSVARALYCYEWAKVNLAEEGGWTLLPSQSFIDGLIKAHEENEQ